VGLDASVDGGSTYVPGSMRMTAASGAAANAALIVTKCPAGPTVTTSSCVAHIVVVLRSWLRVESSRHLAKRAAHVCARRARKPRMGPRDLGDCCDRQQYASPRGVDSVVALADLCGAAADGSRAGQHNR